ncbi:IS1634 family transposase [Domibacillus enclensis]|uniref:Transposase n=1 Tax=Domibacillus enclensis TaxID=1017273 RepID=A0A1N6NUB9_9BACI|nr:IS1634 family transposase [Domibacillus enclensis]OXS80145.1 hypothetical protein B1B05_01300 [Domibacillus enclensis]SIP95562.1 Transposase [Domibacillus enclensis]
MQPNTIKPIHVGVLPFSFAMARMANIQEAIDRAVTWREDNTKVSPGFLIETLTAAIMATHGHMPLSHMEDYWKVQDWELLFRGTNITPAKLNDDAYGRALDKLADVDLEQLCMDISYQLLTQQGCTIQAIHADTTSKSVQGVYDGQDDDAFDITYGHSKDHRPDLKQIKIGLGVQQNGLPLFGHVFSGNVSDQKWSIEAVQSMKAFFEEKGRTAPFILDSSLVTKENLATMEKESILFLSRLPDTFSLTKSAKEQAVQKEEWRPFKSPSGKEYHLYETVGIPCEKQRTSYLLLVVWSKELAAKKEQTLGKKWAKIQEKLAKELAKKEKVPFSCEADAQTAMQESIRSIQEKGFSVHGKIVSATTKQHPGRGRPKKEESPEERTIYTLSFSGLAVHPAFAERELHMASCFVLISSPELDMCAEDRLLLYKKQSRVETRFRLLKDPILFHNVYLKSSRRVKALGYIFYLVLLLLSYLEYQVRRSLEQQDSDWITPDKKKTRTPSVKTIIKTMEGLLTMAIGSERCIAEPPLPQMHHVIEWAGFSTAILVSPIMEMKQHIQP